MANHCALPVGYSPETVTNISEDMIGVLTHDRDYDSTVRKTFLSAFRRFADKSAVLGIQTEYLNVRTEENQIIGVGLLRYNETEGELTSLAVLPTHQRQGIGKWIVARRLDRAYELGLSTVYVESLTETNSITSFYNELGFKPYEGSEPLSIFQVHPEGRRTPELALEL